MLWYRFTLNNFEKYFKLDAQLCHFSTSNNSKVSSFVFKWLYLRFVHGIKLLQQNILK